MFFKIGVLKNFANFTGKHLYRSLFLTKFATKILTQVLSYEICKILKKHFFYRTPLIAASESSRNVFAQQIFPLN